MSLLSVETAIQTPNTQVYYGAPNQNQLRGFILPIFNQILADCPEDLRPVWKHFDGKWVFPNGSYIKLCGCNNKQYDNLRGNKSDLFILDEAGQVDELDIVVDSIALPQLLSSTHPNKRIILPSTPPTTPDHPFKNYAELAQGSGSYSKYTILRSWYPPEEIAKTIKQMGGINSTNVRRELFCEFCTDEALQIVPEWAGHPEYVGEVAKDDLFKFYQVVEALDVGYRDFTAWISGYWDFGRALLVIDNEVAMRENAFTTDNLAKEIKAIEKSAYRDQGNTKRIRRIADNTNLNMLADLSRLHQTAFVAVSKKHGIEWMVNQLRQFIKAGKLIIHPRCKMPIASLEFGIWKKGRDDFERSKTLGHYDFIDALVYLVAVLIPAIQNVNPVPPLYKLPVSDMMFPNGMPTDHLNTQNEEIKKMFPQLLF